MKQFKLIVHHPNFSEEDLIINNKDFSSVAIDDVVEIYHPEDEVSRLLLQVTSIREDFQQKDTISVKQSVANAFQLRTFANVYVNIVKFKDVVLDSIELTFKDQYLGRGDMWRLKKNMENTCVYLNKKIEFCGIRCEVYEMWAQGERVACGTISEDTKIVFRSSTSQVYLFIQLSSEMWDMDISGDLYFEKAVNGFLTDLFYKWKRNGSNHEVTIVLFSRTFYEAQSIEEFPAYMRGCLQLDYKGRFYEDFYRVAVQNERYDDWSVILYELKKLFNGYPKSVLDYHKQEGVHIPKAVNSTAAQGNFLEVLNMSLNVFEKHYLDRSFERTGQLSVVITPGVGVFEVDRELTNITKQRIIDNGVGSDLVCLGEQPLHAVPLFKFHNKNVLNAVDDYSMPHWINLSFYSSSKLINYSSFVPRIKLPQMKTKTHKDNNKIGLISRATKQVKDDDTSFPFVNYDAYDAQVFKLPTAHISGPHHTRSLQRTPNRKRSDQCQHFQPKQVPPYRKFSEADITLFQTELSSHSLTRSPAISIPVQLPDAHSPVSVSSTGVVALEGDKQATPKDNSGRVRHVTNPMDEWEEELSPPLRTIVGSAGSPYSPKTYRAYLLRPGRALINPFDPSHVTIKLTSNRRRWTHVFPLGPTGIFMQQHHYQAVPQGTSNSELASSLGHEGTPMVTEVKRKRSLISHRISESEVDRDRHGIDIPGRGRNVVSRASMYTSEIDRSLTLLWGATGEQEWTPALTTGVDWKSLTIPACLPLTTDYFPDRRSLQNDYLISDYTLLPEDVALDIAQRMGSNARPLSTVDVFEELISQRLQQGFQQIVLPKLMGAGNIGQGNASPQFTPFVARSRSQNAESMQEYFLSIGRIFHKVTLVGSTITVTCFRPRHPYPMLNIQYQYRFQAPDMDNYEVSWVNFMSEKLESFNWNYLDHYVCWRGQGQFNLIEVCSLRSLKYWRFRVFLIPYHTHATRKQFDDLENYYGRTPLTPEREMQMIDNFLRIIEVVNKIRKPFIPRKPRKSGTFSKPLLTRASQPLMQTTPLIQGSAPSSSQMRAGVTAVHAGPFRDRVGSNRLHDRPRMHSGPSKMIERVRCESGNGGRISPAGEIMDSREVSFSSQSLDAGTDSVNESCGDDISTGSSSVPATPELRKFSVSSPRIDIIEGMKQQPDGLVFLSKQQGTPSTVFISADAAAWIVDHVEGAGYPEAMDMLEDMLSNGVICHASGCEDYPMIYGFHLYYFVSNEKELDIDSWQPSGDLAAFQSEWLEVSVRTKLIRSTVENVPSCYKRSMKERDQFRDSSCTPKTSDNSLSKPGRRISRKKSMYKECNISLEPNEKLARTEWGHQRYHHAFVPGNAFEISMNWMVATNSMISELLQSWNRKATSFNFQLAPVPNDPFALPFSYKSDPLRAPIFIPLNMDFLVKNFSVPDQISELIKFQEKIADHFGFISCVSEQDNDVDSQNYYIHISGYMFLMIPTRPKELQGICIPKQNRSSSHMSHLNVGSISSPHEEYITRHVMGKSGKCVYEEMDGSRIGFLLSWNHMFTKRWKSQTIATADDIITNKTFKDIRALCSDEYLLQTVWEDHLWEEEV